jgi:hypothetical protein
LDDRLRILEWQDGFSGREGVQAACSAAHVQQLVAHWMATGTLNYSVTEPWQRSWASILRKHSHHTGPNLHPAINGAKQLVELSVDREGLKRVLQENPASLISMLEALVSAIQGQYAGEAGRAGASAENDHPLACLQ